MFDVIIMRREISCAILQAVVQLVEALRYKP
jgi:hypothetical protein